MDQAVTIVSYRCVVLTQVPDNQGTIVNEADADRNKNDCQSVIVGNVQDLIDSKTGNEVHVETGIVMKARTPLRLFYLLFLPMSAI